MRHKHYDCIIAWAEGAEIEFLSHENYGHKKWMPVISSPGWHEGTQYRIKPQPKPDVVRYVNVYNADSFVTTGDAYHTAADARNKAAINPAISLRKPNWIKRA